MNTSAFADNYFEADLSAPRERLRIAHVVDYLMPLMGYQEYLLPKWNARHGHDVHIFTTDRYAPVPDYDDTFGRLMGARIVGPGLDRMDGMSVHRLPTPWEFRMRPWIGGLERAIAGVAPQVIFCHGSTSTSALRVARLAKRIGVPVLMDNHMVFSVMNKSLAGRAFVKALRFATHHALEPTTHRFLGVAEECCDYLREVQGVPPDKVDRLPLGLDTDLFAPDPAARERLRSRLRIPMDAKVVMQTGKLTRDKSPHWLGEAMAQVMIQRNDVWLVFVGSGSKQYREEIAAPIQAAHAEERLRFTPLVPARELSGFYSMADLCVYPDGTSLSCVEAAACGRAVVMTDLPASRWRAELGVGVCYRTGDVENLRRTIDSILSDDAGRAELGRRAAETVHREFSYDAIATKSERLMHDAIAAHRNSERT